MPRHVPLSADQVIAAYARGWFPMADPRTGRIGWFAPSRRGVLPLDGAHCSRRLARSMRRFRLSSDRAFETVIDACADREDTWISPEVRAAYVALHRRGRAHSVEAWRDGALAGGLYGVEMGGAFMAESMFHRVTDAGKAAVIGLVRHLARRGFVLLDLQMVTGATKPLGAIEIPRDEYLRRLAAALPLTPGFGTIEPHTQGAR